MLVDERRCGAEQMRVTCGKRGNGGGVVSRVGTVGKGKSGRYEWNSGKGWERVDSVGHMWQRVGKGEAMGGNMGRGLGVESVEKGGSGGALM